MIYDFHTHSFLSDGELSPIELIRRAIVQGYRGLAITDHASPGNLEHVIQTVSADCALAREEWNFLAIPGVELTHVPATAIDKTAALAKKRGAWLVVVHGETTAEPVQKGTNRAAVASRFVDILAHPGFLNVEEVKAAIANGIFIEVTARKGHSLTNGYVASLARRYAVKLLINSDAHSSEDLLTGPLARAIARGAGLGRTLQRQALSANPQLLLQKLNKNLPTQHIARWL